MAGKVYGRTNRQKLMIKLLLYMPYYGKLPSALFIHYLIINSPLDGSAIKMF